MNSSSSNPPATSESKVDDGMLENLRNCSGECAENIAMDPGSSPIEIIKAIDAKIKQIQSSNDEPPESPFDDVPLHLGSLFGEQLVAAYQWEWVKLTFHSHGDSKAIGVVSPNRAWVICPFHYVCGCLMNDVTPFFALAFDVLDVTQTADENGDEHHVILRESGVPTSPPNSYANLMAEFSEHGNQ